ncbi:MAG: hypothetical protein ABI068_05880, partial [Ktedonobacterales bacterium]
MEQGAGQDEPTEQIAPVVVRSDTGKRGKQQTRSFQTGMGQLKPLITIEGGRKALRVGGVIQSVAVDERYVKDVWDAMLPTEAPGRALILGLGGGTVATLMTKRWGAFPIIGVERDPAVVWLARHEFGLNNVPHVQVVVEDAFAFVRRYDTRAEGSFGAICVDLYVAGRMAHGALAPAFLRDLKRILTPDGEVMFNLWRSPFLTDQLRRIKRIFTISLSVEAD